MSRILTIAFLLAAVIMAMTANTSLAKDKPRIAVASFENKAGGWGGWRLGDQAADMLVTKLVKSKQFSVYERDKLATIMQEQDLGASGRITQESAAKIGKLIGVEYMVIGSVTEFGKSDADGHVPNIAVSSDTYSGTVDVRVIDVNTGEILLAETGSSKSSNVRVRFMGIGGGKGYDEKKAHTVLRGAIDEVADKIVMELTN
ncbi:hypothetical protein JW905_00555 [bacterium]|nr:hypothetical protein [candidate division CSSED10-310 bacterium]